MRLESRQYFYQVLGKQMGKLVFYRLPLRRAVGFLFLKAFIHLSVPCVVYPASLFFPFWNVFDVELEVKWSENYQRFFYITGWDNVFLPSFHPSIHPPKYITRLDNPFKNRS